MGLLQLIFILGELRSLMQMYGAGECRGVAEGVEGGRGW